MNLKIQLKRAVLVGILLMTSCSPTDTLTQPEVIPAETTAIKETNPAPEASTQSETPQEKTVLEVKNQWVWQVSKDSQPTSYLVGSVHAPFAKDFDPPQAFWDLFEKVDTFYMEADITQAASIAQKAIAQAIDPTQDLSQMFGPKLWPELVKRLKPIGITEDILKAMKLWYVHSLLGVSTTQDSVKPPDPTLIMDSRLRTFAEEKKLNLGFLETPEAQLAQIQKISSFEYLRLIKLMLEENKNVTQSDVTSVFKAYNSGEESAFEAIEQSLKEDSEEFHKFVLVERNNAWINTLNTLLPQKSVMVAAGNLHMNGTSGLVAQLKALGYQVDRVNF